ncbi:hypothetical protein Plano_1122 [Planococcus sp. PAMC 21323]|nr:hypothetical protein Plano_1122 [Planococcus sp. PAMC 21323]
MVKRYPQASHSLLLLIDFISSIGLESTTRVPLCWQAGHFISTSP